MENFDAIAIHAETVNRVPVWYFTAHALQEKKLGPVAEYRFEKGTVYFGRDYGSGPKAEYVYEGDDGTVTDYGKIAKGERLQKFYDAIQAVRTGSRPVCTVQCAIPHLEAVEQIARIPIVQVPEPWMQDLHEEDDTFHTIKDLQKTFTWCYTHQEMPSSVGFLDEK